MLYSDGDIVISDSIENDIIELLELCSKYSIREELITHYHNRDEPISEPFLSMKQTVYRYLELDEIEYVETRELYTIIGKKNESKEEQGYTPTKLLIISS